MGDWIILPSKQKPAIHIAEVKGNYTFNPEGENPFFHYRNIEWIAQDVPRTNFDQDLLHSFGASMAICQVSRNDAETRVRNMAKNGWKSSGVNAKNSRENPREASDDSNRRFAR